MNHAQLDTMESLEAMQLVLRISGAVEQSNLADFEADANAVLDSINTDLETDEDFAEAEENIKSCQLIETRIANARADALNSTKDIATLIATTERLEAKFRATRLLLNGKVKTEKEARKNEIVDGAKNHLQGMLLQSPVRHAFVIDFKAIQEATKGKRSISKMRQAVQEIVDAEELRMAGMEQDFQLNLSTINKSEEQYPGLYPDKKNLALSSPEVVETQIINRVLQYKISMQEKAEKERLAREEKERLAAIPPKAEEAPVLPPEPFTQWTPPPPPGAQLESYEIVVEVETADIAAVLKSIWNIQGVTHVNAED